MSDVENKVCLIQKIERNKREQDWSPNLDFDWISIKSKQQEIFYQNYGDDDWFNFVKRYMLLLESKILKNNIILSLLPLFIIHIIAKYSSAIFYPLFIIPKNLICEFCIERQMKKFVLEHYVYKFEFVICDKKLHIKHKASYYPNKGIFYCCNLDNNKITGFAYNQKNVPIIDNSENDNQVYVSIELEYKGFKIRITIYIHQLQKGFFNDKNAHSICYEIDNKNLNYDECCGIGLLNVQNYKQLANDEHGTCSVLYKKGMINKPIIYKSFSVEFNNVVK